MDSDKLADLGNKVVDLGSAAVQSAVAEYTIYYQRLVVIDFAVAGLSLLVALLTLFWLMPRAAGKEKAGQTVSEWMLSNRDNGPSVAVHVLLVVISLLMFCITAVEGLTTVANPKAKAISKVCSLIRGK